MALKKNNSVLDWLLETDQPVARYYALTDLLGHSAADEEARDAYAQIPKLGWAKRILDKQKPRGYWESRKNLYLPKYLATIWQTIVLVDFGLTSKIKHVRMPCEMFFKDWLSSKEKIDGEGEACVSGNLARTLSRAGYSRDWRVKRLFYWLVENQKEDGGWHCFPSNKGTLDCWEPLSAFAAVPRSQWTKRMKRSVERGAEFYLERRLFKEGKKKYTPWFRFHYPVHYYYDILVGLDVITRLGYGKDERLHEALEILNTKQLEDGTWALDAVHPDLAWNSSYRLRRPPTPFVIEEPGRPSKWITLNALRVLNRVS